MQTVRNISVSLQSDILIVYKMARCKYKNIITAKTRDVCKSLMSSLKQDLDH